MAPNDLFSPPADLILSACIEFSTLSFFLDGAAPLVSRHLSWCGGVGLLPAREGKSMRFVERERSSLAV